MRHFWTEQLNANDSQKGHGKESHDSDGKKAVMERIRELIAKLKGRQR
jgi:hypothetical protein